MKYKIVIALTAIGVMVGYAIAVRSFLFTGDFVTWRALLGVIIAVQTQFVGIAVVLALKLGDISGQIKRM